MNENCIPGAAAPAPSNLFAVSADYQRDSMHLHRVLTGVDVLYRDVLMLQRKTDVWEILLDAIRELKGTVWWSFGEHVRSYGFTILGARPACYQLRT